MFISKYHIQRTVNEHNNMLMNLLNFGSCISKILKNFIQTTNTYCANTPILFI